MYGASTKEGDSVICGIASMSLTDSMSQSRLAFVSSPSYPFTYMFTRS